VGRLLGGYLAREHKARLVLVGRSPFPPREEWSALAEDPAEERDNEAARDLLAWEAAGAEVMVAQADVADEEAMARVVAAADERFGRLNGVLHTAGVTSGSSLYRPFTDMGREESETQFGPKVHGVYVLEKLLAGRELDFCLLFSSNASVLGGLGYSIYAAVNLFMDHFATARKRRGGIPWVSASWDGWPQETRKYQDVQTSMDQYTMTRDEGREAFRRVASLGPEGAVAVPVGDLEARLAIWIHGGGDDGGGATTHSRPDVGTYVAPEGETEEKVAEIWQEVLGIHSVGRIDNFFDLGGHSLLATRLVSRLNDGFRLEFPLGRFFEAPTVEGCARILEELGGGAGDEDKAAILSLLEELSEDEAEEQLAGLLEADE
jgi:NAD(P)-dependent dehydrogenase (short-subunit alcohol dehydrogenase family)/acyl carrier protein